MSAADLCLLIDDDNFVPSRLQGRGGTDSGDTASQHNDAFCGRRRRHFAHERHCPLEAVCSAWNRSEIARTIAADTITPSGLLTRYR
nr:hypothetical protein [Novosphingobium panipatense]